MVKKLLKPAAIILLVSLFIEIFIFNSATWLSRLDGKPVDYNYTTSLGEADKLANSDYYLVNRSKSVSILTDGPALDINYIYVDFEAITEDNYAVHNNVTVSICDEGNADFYSMPKTTMYSSMEESKYISINPYGDVTRFRITIDPDSSEDTLFKINSIVFNPDIPLFFSWLRFLLLFSLLCVLWAIRPSSSIYNIKYTKRQKKNALIALCGANIVFFIILICFNTGFYFPSWTHHQQYHKLAVAITEGRVNIETGYEDVVSSLTNPYDTTLRRTQLVNGYWSVWDMAFYDGEFYVYFGIVPVLIFYLPFYLLTGKAFPTIAGIFIMACIAMIGVYYLMHQITKRYFQKVPFALYLILSFIVANSIGTIPILMRPDFYSLPIISALAFTIWGLGLWFSAAHLWNKEFALGNNNTLSEESAYRFLRKLRIKIVLRLLFGGLLMALVAGCRPQFLVGSFFIFFIFNTCISKSWKNTIKGTRKQLILRTIITLMPYIVVALGIMYYNYIRFDSPFDFGANYNLTTNDMTHRGFNLGRFEDGIWMYLFQPPNIGMKFPYLYSTAFNSDYMGVTIREAMYGGAFCTQLLTLALIALRLVYKDLKKRGLLGFTITSIAFAFIVVIADSQMAGILSRYYYDFLWLLLIPASIVIMQLWLSFKNLTVRKIIVVYIMICLISSLAINLAIGFQASNITAYNDFIHNFVRYLFS